MVKCMFPTTSKSSQSVVQVRQLKKEYILGDVIVRALRGVDIEIFQGEFIAIMGTSGSGKTTLLNLIGGLDSITSGDIIIDNKNLAKMSDKERTTLRRFKMGFIFQFYNLIPTLTAFENVELPLKITKVSKSERKERVTRLMEQVGLTDRMKNKPDQLSGGQQQRVAIARALATDPLIIFADEPTGDLDSETGQEVINLLVSLNKEFGKTILMVTHDRKIAEHASKIYNMKDGTITNVEKLR